MSRGNRIEEFIQKSLDAGIPLPLFVGLLTARGWTEKQAYSALADLYQRETGIEVPPRPNGGASARDAFFYLLIFSTLSVWTLSLGCLAFSLIERWLADPLFRRYGETFNTYTVTMSLAAVIVAFPLYLLVSRLVLREAAADPDKLESGIRKWLTYMALVIAAAVFMGDLITALAYLLRGELTSRFLAKSFVVLVLSSGVFWYYFGGLRRMETLTGRFGRDRIMALASTGIVVIMIVLGFPPASPRFRAHTSTQSPTKPSNIFRLRVANTSSVLFSPRAVHGRKIINRSTAIRTRGLIPPVATASCSTFLLFLPSRATTTTPTESPDPAPSVPQCASATSVTAPLRRETELARGMGLDNELRCKAVLQMSASFSISTPV